MASRHTASRHTASRYAVGLDLGDGESVVAWADVNDRQPPRPFERASGEVNVITALGTDRTGATLIGAAALGTPEVRHVRVNFKRRPVAAASGITPRIEAVDFAQRLLIEFFEQHPEVADGCVVYVGHPAGWDPVQHVEPYRQQLADALRPHEVRMVAESQSAFLHLHDAAGGDPTRRPALVIDIGSSTIDFTALDDQGVNSFGSDLGCRLIDEAIAASVVAALPAEARQRLAEPTPRSLLLWLCRLRKEAAYDGSVAIPPEPESGLLRWVIETCWPVLAALDVTAIVDGGWRGEFQRELRRAGERLGPGRPALVLVIGGGSRMPFVIDGCQEVFGSGEVVALAHPSLAVAQGLASYGRWEHRVEAFHREIGELPGRIGVAEAVRRQSRQISRSLYQTWYRSWGALLLDAVESGAARPADLTTVSGALTYYVDWLDTPAGESSRVEILGPLESELNRRLGPEAERLCLRFGMPADALAVRVRLPGGVIVRPRNGFIRVWVRTGDALNALTLRPVLQMRGKLARRYIRASMRMSRSLVDPVGRMLAGAFDLQSADLATITDAISVAIAAQLTERARAVEQLLA